MDDQTQSASFLSPPTEASEPLLSKRTAVGSIGQPRLKVPRGKKNTSKEQEVEVLGAIKDHLLAKKSDTNVQQKDEYELFADSLVPSFRRLSPRNFAMFKAKVATILLDLEFDIPTGNIGQECQGTERVYRPASPRVNEGWRGWSGNLHSGKQSRTGPNWNASSTLGLQRSNFAASTSHDISFIASTPHFTAIEQPRSFSPLLRCYPSAVDNFSSASYTSAYLASASAIVHGSDENDNSTDHISP